MPNRIIRDGLLTSERFDALNWREQCFFTRLLLVVDDYGRYDARGKVLRSILFPLSLDKVSQSDVESCLKSLEAAGLVRLYEVAGKPYLEVLNFRQRVRAKVSKYPSPNGEENDGHMSDMRLTDDGHMTGTCLTDDGHMLAKTEAKTNSESESKSEARPRARAQEAPPPESVEEVVRYMRNQPDVMLNAGQLQLCAESFFGEYGAIGWTLKGQPVRDWRKLAHSYMAKWQLNENRPRGKGGGGGKKWNISNAAPQSNEQYKGL